MTESGPLLLSINTGSSTVKLGLYCATIDSIATSSALAAGQNLSKIREFEGKATAEPGSSTAGHAALVDGFLDQLTESGEAQRVVGVGHRLVHGGFEYRQPCRIDATVRGDLDRVVPLAPNHLPQALAVIDRVAQRQPDWPQVACFDTAFHRTLPPRARTLGLTHQLAEEGIIRFGFHGLSYEYLVECLRRLDPDRLGGRAVLAHLGNGASMAAVDRGICIDTSMGFTPIGGLVMGTRSGDLDPGVLAYLLESQHWAPADVTRLVSKQSGLLGISGTTADMRELMARRATDERAHAAVELFCYQAKKFLAAYAGALGGLDTVVFTGGIGQHAPEIRAQICENLEFLGLRLDAERNAAQRPVISATGSAVIVRLIPTDEDQMIARHTHALLHTPDSAVK
ncbi:MAG TPA: acetate/propionate family kinase [Pirellulales bacterium]|jgi:acetate kinase